MNDFYSSITDSLKHAVNLAEIHARITKENSVIINHSGEITTLY